MKIIAYVFLWIIIWFIAVTIKVYLGEFMYGADLAKPVKSLVMSIPTGVCAGIGVALHSRINKVFVRNTILKTKKDSL